MSCLESAREVPWVSSSSFLILSSSMTYEIYIHRCFCKNYNNSMSIFADDTKAGQIIAGAEDQKKLQAYLATILENEVRHSDMGHAI